MADGSAASGSIPVEPMSDNAERQRPVLVAVDASPHETERVARLSPLPVATVRARR